MAIRFHIARVLAVAACLSWALVAASAQGELPALADRPVNDFAGVIDACARQLNRRDVP